MTRESLTWKSAMQEFRLTWSGEAWGDTLGVWFDVANEMYNRGMPVPSKWEYRPAPMAGAQEVSDYWREVFTDMPNKELQRFGRVLHRYAGILKQAGKDY